MVSTRDLSITSRRSDLNPPRHPEGRTAGFTLIESMIAALILTVGLLALSGMQGLSLGRNVDAFELSRIANLGSDILERIQFNRFHATDYNNLTVSSTAPCPTSGIGPMALGDCSQWRQRLLGSGLPDVQGQISAVPIVTTPSLNQTQVTVTISWTGSTHSDTSKRRPKTVQVQAIVTPE